MTMTLVYVTNRCLFCGEFEALSLDPELYARWQGGEHVQDVWPDWTKGQRELLITGTHPECWDKAFGPDEEEEPEGLVVGPPEIHWPDDIWNTKED